MSTCLKDVRTLRIQREKDDIFLGEWNIIFLRINSKTTIWKDVRADNQKRYKIRIFFVEKDV